MSIYEPWDYQNKGGIGEYPAPPGKCPFKDCRIPLEMKKHGYYERYFLTTTFTGSIRIRRYRCPKCGRTLSMLPSFCLAGYIYGVELVITLIKQVYELGSVRRVATEWQTKVEGISRRIISKYIARLQNNRGMIQYGINQMSPDNIGMGRLSGDIEWTERFLSGIQPALAPEFNARFHKETGISFMSLQTKIA